MTKIEIYDGLDPGKIASSGQCFRVRSFRAKQSDPRKKSLASADDVRTYVFVSGDRILHIKEVKTESETLTGADLQTGAAGFECKTKQVFEVSCDETEWHSFWHNYFDIGRSYRDVAARAKGKSEFADEAAKRGFGLRILRQEPWEMLVTFIISQRKSIPSIAKSVEKLAEKFGHEIKDGIRSFPSPEELAGASESDLAQCGLGYRVGYVQDAVKKADHEAEVMSDFILGKSMFDMHPETMPQYIEALKWGDYKWQILNRLLLLYQTFKDTMDMDTMAIITVTKEQMDKEEKSDQ